MTSEDQRTFQPLLYILEERQNATLIVIAFDFLSTQKTLKNCWLHTSDLGVIVEDRFIILKFVVSAKGGISSETELDQLCLENIVQFKRPKRYYFVENLPKNNYGKVFKVELRKKMET